MGKKQKHRDNVAFQDYRQDANKSYKRQQQRMPPDLEAYENERAAAVERAAASGGLEIVEAEDGELVAVDKNGTFYATADSTSFVENRPDRAAVDRLVADLKKAEEVRLKKRRERGITDDDADVTYINDKNKHFNQKLARFYNKVSQISDPVMGGVRANVISVTVHRGDSGQLRTRNDDMNISEQNNQRRDSYFTSNNFRAQIIYYSWHSTRRRRFSDSNAGWGVRQAPAC